MIGVVEYGFPEVQETDMAARYGAKEEEKTIPTAPHLPKRGFWQTYTLGNIWREIRHRLGKGR